MPRIVIDLDDTIATADDRPYPERKPDLAVVERLREYSARGFEIIVHTSRNMRTYGGSVGKINVHTLPVIIDWLRHHEVPFDEIVVGKPWCEHGGFYVDDKTVRPREFVTLSYEEICELVGVTAPQ